MLNLYKYVCKVSSERLHTFNTVSTIFALPACTVRVEAVVSETSAAGDGLILPIALRLGAVRIYNVEKSVSIA